MFPEENRKRQERLSNCILELSEKVLDEQQNEHFAVIKKLQVIYKDGYKHLYSDFFPILLKIVEQNNDCDIEYLATNLEVIRETLEIDYSNGTNQYTDIYEQFTKLCDHLNLQISEITFFSSTESKINDAIATMRQTDNNLRKAQEELSEASLRAKTLQTELIAVLSIFAAIVITFSGGFTFLGSVMTSINEAKCYEMIILTAMICGIIMFNTIFLMMSLVAKITERNIYARCITPDCSCDSNKCRCNGLKRIRKRLPYVFYFNVFGLLGIIITCVVWGIRVNG